jgi:hypothetical protein
MRVKVEFEPPIALRLRVAKIGTSNEASQKYYGKRKRKIVGYRRRPSGKQIKIGEYEIQTYSEEKAGEAREDKGRHSTGFEAVLSKECHHGDAEQDLDH